MHTIELYHPRPSSTLMTQVKLTNLEPAAKWKLFKHEKCAQESRRTKLKQLTG